LDGFVSSDFARLFRGVFETFDGIYCSEHRELSIHPGADFTLFHVRQARRDDPGKPYRERLYTVHVLGDRSLLLDIHHPPEDLSKRDFLSPEHVEMFSHSPLKQHPPPAARLMVLAGKTGFDGGLVPSRIACRNGSAAWITSRLELFTGGMTTWDRGFDSEGRQVWGPGEEGTKFRRVSRE
jgi:CpeT protein